MQCCCRKIIGRDVYDEVGEVKSFDWESMLTALQDEANIIKGFGEAASLGLTMADGSHVFVSMPYRNRTKARNKDEDEHVGLLQLQHIDGANVRTIYMRSSPSSSFTIGIASKFDDQQEKPEIRFMFMDGPKESHRRNRAKNNIELLTRLGYKINAWDLVPSPNLYKVHRESLLRQAKYFKEIKDTKSDIEKIKTANTPPLASNTTVAYSSAIVAVSAAAVSTSSAFFNRNLAVGAAVTACVAAIVTTVFAESMLVTNIAAGVAVLAAAIANAAIIIQTIRVRVPNLIQIFCALIGIAGLLPVTMVILLIYFVINALKLVSDILTAIFDVIRQTRR